MTSVMRAAHVHANVPIVSAADLNFVESPIVSRGCDPPFENLPRVVRGRKNEIQALANATSAGVSVLVGPPGSGKTTIALAAAHKLDGDRRVFWVSAHNHVSFLDSMAAVAAELGANQAEIAHAREEGSADLAWRLLTSAPDAEDRPGRSMLVIDNANDPGLASDVIRRAMDLSAQRWHTVVTTIPDNGTLAGSGSARTTVVTLPSREDCAHLLLDRIRELDQRQRELALPAALQAADLLGRLPLALHLAGSNQGSPIVRHTLDGYAAELGRAARGRVNQGFDEPSEHFVHAVNLALAAFAPDERTAASRLLGLLAAFAPAQPFPLSVLATAVRPLTDVVDPRDRAVEPLLQRIVRTLEQTALIECSVYDDLHVVAVHPLVASAMRHVDPEVPGTSAHDVDASAASALDTVTLELDSRSADGVTTGDAWPLWRLLVPHIAHVLVHTQTTGERAALRSAHRAVRRMMGHGMYRAAARMAEGAVERVADFPERDRYRLTAILDRGLAYQAGGDLQRAFPDIEHVAWISRHYGDPDDPAVMSSGHCLAAIQHEQGRLADSKRHFDEVLAGRTRILGADHLDTLSTMHSLAAVIQATGDAAEAEAMLTTVVARRIRLLGEHHPETLSARHSLAYARQANGGPGSLQVAEDDFDRILDDRTAVLGATHPDTLLTKHNLAWIEQAKGNFSKAERSFRSVMHVQLCRVGRYHPHTVATAANLAWDLLQQRQFATARLLFTQVLKIRISRLGINHPETQTTRGNIGWLTYEEGDFRRAEFRFRKLLHDRIRSIGTSHPRTLTTRHNLALTLRSQGRLEAARDEFVNVLSEQITAVGESHDSTLATKYNLAVTLRLFRERRWLDAAIEMLDEVLTAQMERFPARDPLVLQTKRELVAALLASHSDREDIHDLLDGGLHVDEDPGVTYPGPTGAEDLLVSSFVEHDILEYPDPDIVGFA